MQLGDTISHYEVLDELGRGGMGVVYKAQDTKLNRVVALKLLPAHMLGSDDDRARFFREARAAAALHHPNIATIFEIDEHDEQPFIAMEYVDGGSLADRIADGPFSLDEVIRVASQIATALKLAHQTDIVHRDIKSANVMLTADGTAKILDFGLAKTAASTKLTQMGSTLGTVAYMSPEQARGQEVDGRSDIWSLGVVLYEMVSGKLPFPGDYEQAVVYGILNEEPHPLTAIRTGVPMELEWVVNKCLAKDPDLRYQSAGEIPGDLKAIQLRQSRISAPVSGVNAPTAIPKRSLPRWAFVVGSLVVGVAIGAGLFAGLSGDATQANQRVGSTKRLTLKLPPDAPLATVGSAPLSLGLTAMTISSDGESLVYVAHSGTTTALYHVALPSGEVTRLDGTEGAYAPFLSPDGRWVAFFAGTNLMKVDLTGGVPLLLAEASDPIGGTWVSTDEIAYSTDQGSRIVRVSSSGGEPTPFLDNGKPLAGDLPFTMPNGDILYSIRGGLWSSGRSDSNPHDTEILGSDGRWLPTGHILSVRPGRLFATLYNSLDRVPKGAGVPVVDDLRGEAIRGAGQYTVSDEGTLVYVSGRSADLGRLVWVGRDGSEEVLDFEPDYFGTFRLSPSGDQLLQLIGGGSTDLWLYDLNRKNRTRIHKSVFGAALWSPDGSSVVYTAMAGDSTRIHRRSLANNLDQTIGVTTHQITLSWMAPDGESILVNDRVGYREVKEALLTAGQLEFTNVASHGSFNWGGTFSPDGRYAAYTSGASGRSEVWVTALDGTGSRWQVSTEGGEEPIWSPTTNEIFFSRTPRWHSVAYELSPTPTFGPPKLMFENDYMQIGGFGYAVAPDASRFLVVKPVEAAPRPTELNVVVNWFEELERLVPTEIAN